MERLIRLLPDEVDGEAVDGALVTSPQNGRYLTEFESTDSIVLITRSGGYFITDFRYADAARRAVKSCQVVMHSGLGKTLRELIRRHGLKRVLTENASLTLGEAENYDRIFREEGAALVKDKTLDGILRGLRAVKTPEEIQKIRDAQKLTDMSFDFILPKLRPGVTERQIALELEFYMRRQGADGVAFDLIVVSGKNGSLCHGVPSEKEIQRGDFVTMDIGALLNGYHSDMTRTVAVGSVSEEQRLVYETVLKAQTEALKAVRPGIECCVVDKVARDVIDRDYPGTFGHSTGHSVGVEIHEWPNFSPNCHEITRPGMVITVEPGIYLEGKFGVRIEDMVALTEEGYENLTHSPKELLIL